MLPEDAHAIARRRDAESPPETAARLGKKYGVQLTDRVRQPLPRQAYDEMWDNDAQCCS